MLDAFRRGAKSWVAKGLMVLLIASFAVWGIGDVFSTRLDSTVASVGDRDVTVDQFANALQRQRTTLSQQAGRAVTYQDMREAGIDRQILQGLIRDAAFEVELDRLGIAAPDSAVAEAIRETPAFQQAGGGFSDPAYRLALARIGYTPAQFEELTRTLLGQELLTGLAMANTEPPTGVAQRVAVYREERRRVSYVLIPRSEAPEPEDPGTATLEAYFAENAEAFRMPERRSGRFLHVDIAALAAELRPGEAEIAAEYEATRERYTTPATRTIDQLPLPAGEAEAIAERVISDDASFEDVARELGEDPATLDLGTVERDDLPEVTAEPVFAATAPGVIGPVPTPIGQALIRIRALEEGGVAPLEEVRERIADQMAQDRALARAPDIATRIEDARAAGATFSEMAEIDGVRSGRFDGLARDDAGAEGLPGREAFRAEAFAALDHEEREILQTAEGGFFLVLVEAISESRIPELSEVRDEVLSAWRLEERQAAVEQLAAERATTLGPVASLAPLAEELGLQVVEPAPFTRAEPPGALAGGIAEEMFAARPGGIVAGPAAGGTGAIVARLDEIVTAEPQALDSASQAIAGRFSAQIADDQRMFFVRAIEARHQPTIRPDAIEATYQLLGANTSGEGG